MANPLLGQVPGVETHRFQPVPLQEREQQLCLKWTSKVCGACEF